MAQHKTSRHVQQPPVDDPVVVKEELDSFGLHVDLHDRALSLREKTKAAGFEWKVVLEILKHAAEKAPEILALLDRLMGSVVSRPSTSATEPLPIEPKQELVNSGVGGEHHLRLLALREKVTDPVDYQRLVMATKSKGGVFLDVMEEVFGKPPPPVPDAATLAAAKPKV